MGDLLTIHEVAEHVHAQPETVRYWRKNGRGPRSFKVGRRVMFRRTDVEVWLQEQYEKGQA